MIKSDLHGIHVPLITPFTATGALDLPSFHRLAVRMIERGVRGLVIAGTTGESPTLSWDEIERLTSVALELRPAGVSITVGTGTNATAESAARTRAAGRLGADAVLVVVPYYNRPAPAGVVEHFRRVAAEGVPIIAYNIPYRTGLSPDVATLREIMGIDGVVAIKETSGGLDNTLDLVADSERLVLAGEDALFLPALLAGAGGGILASAHLETEQFLAVDADVRAGRYGAARDTFRRLLPLIGLLFAEPNPAPLKWVLARQGLIASPALRLPMTPIGPALEAALGRAIDWSS
jgi:4-hydroxy-tetrahydrodipicolinate synthase